MGEMAGVAYRRLMAHLGALSEVLPPGTPVGTEVPPGGSRGTGWE